MLLFGMSYICLQIFQLIGISHTHFLSYNPKKKSTTVVVVLFALYVLYVLYIVVVVFYVAVGFLVFNAVRT